MSVALLVLAICCVTAFMVSRDILFPPVILGIVWTVVLVLAMLSSQQFLPISSDTLLLVSAGVCSFTLASVLVYLVLPRPTKSSSLGSSTQLLFALVKQFRVRLTPELLLLISLVALPLVILRVHSFASGGPTANWFINVRLAFNQEGESIGWLNYAGYSSALAATLVLWSEWATKKRASSGLPWASTILAVAHALLTTGRTALVTVLVSTAGVLLILERASWRAVSACVLGVGATLFIAMTLVLRKGGDVSDGFASNVGMIWRAFSAYLLAPLWALDVARISDPSGNAGVDAFRFLQTLTASLRLSDPAPPRIEPWVYTPEPTNVYTVHLVYLRSGGVLFTLACQAVFGALHSFVYARAKDKSHVAAVFYGLMLYPLMMQFFADQYASLTSLWLQMSFLVLVLAANGNPGSKPRASFGAA